MNRIEGGERRQSSLGVTVEMLWAQSTGSVPTGGVHNLTINRRFTGVPSTRRSTKMGIFSIMSIIYASCLSSGYNQKVTPTPSVISVLSHTVFQTRPTATIGGVWETSVQPLCSRGPTIFMPSSYHLDVFVCLQNKIVVIWVRLLQDLKRRCFHSRQR